MPTCIRSDWLSCATLKHIISLKPKKINWKKKLSNGKIKVKCPKHTLHFVNIPSALESCFPIIFLLNNVYSCVKCIHVCMLKLVYFFWFYSQFESLKETTVCVFVGPSVPLTIFSALFRRRCFPHFFADDFRTLFLQMMFSALRSALSLWYIVFRFHTHYNPYLMKLQYQI